jgi:Ca2+-binding RTX toxin-like protein
MATFTGTSGSDTANAVTGTLTGFSGGTLADLQDAIGDTINGLDGIDWIVGGSGADRIDGGTGADTLEGGGGDDTLVSTSNDLTEASVNGGSGTDLLIVNHSGIGLPTEIRLDFMTITFGFSFFTTTFQSIERLQATGSDGNDFLFGGVLNDTLIGGGGDDVIDGGGGVDVLDGGAGTADFLILDRSAATANIVFQVADQLSMPFAFDNGTTVQRFERIQLRTGSGNDLIVGGGVQFDYIYGGGGNDTLDGGAGADEVRGEEGDDLLYLNADSTIELRYDGGTGNDTLVVSRATATANLVFASGIFVTDQGGQWELYSIERFNFIGGSGNDTCYGGALNDVLLGNNGNDFLVGLDDADYIAGGAGADVLYGGLTTGVDSETTANVLLGEVGSDTIFGSGGADFIDGGIDGDLLYGQGGADVILGVAGDDTVWAGAGGDYIQGGSGVNVLYGEAGIDIMILEGTLDYADGGADQNYYYRGAAGASLITGGAAADILIGGAFASNDTFNGGGGDDYALGGGGNDSLTGGAGNDILIGEDGSDTLEGGAGFNYLYADGAGSDQIRVNAADGGDQLLLFFESGGANDVVRLLGSSLGGFADVQTLVGNAGTVVNGNLMQNLGVGCLLTLNLAQANQTNIWFLGNTAASLTAADFMFG